MKKVWLVAVYEYLHHVRRRRFIFALLSMPIFVGVMALVGVIVVLLMYNPKPYGYVDLSGWLTNPLPPPPSKFSLLPSNEIRRYEDEASARKDLSSGKIQAYYVLESDYLKTGHVRVVSKDASDINTNSEFGDFLRLNLLTGYPAALTRRVLDGGSVTVRAADGSRQMRTDQWWNIILPVLSGILFIFIVNMSSGYLLQAVVDEKENRTMEIIITSISPNQLMAGKIIGNLSVGLTQMIVWIGFTLLGIAVARQLFFPDLRLTIDLGYLGLLLITLLLAFIMAAALMAAVGSTTTEAREAQQVAVLFTLPMMAPFYFIATIISNPNGPLSLGLSLFPLTAPISLPLRAAFTNIPVWQLAISLGLLLAGATGSIWLAGRAFHLGLLRYGKRLSLKELFGKA